MIDALAENIFTRLTYKQDYVISSGWNTHQVYVTLTEEKGTYQIRIDNLGEGVDKHEPIKKDQSTQYYPYTAETSNKKTLDYIKDLIRAEVILAEKDALKAIYIKTSNRYNSTHPAFNKQNGLTCVVKSHEVGLQIRLKDKLFKWYVNKRLEISSQYDKIQEMKFDDNFNQYSRLRKLPKWVGKKLVTYYLDKNKLPLLLPQCNVDIKTIFEELSIVKIQPKIDKVKVPEIENKYDDANEFKIDESSSQTKVAVEKGSIEIAVLLKDIFYQNSNKQVFISGASGMGKSTLCQHIANQWANNNLWNNIFKFVFHIRLRFFNIEHYPAGKTHSLFDIVNRECFQNTLPASIESLFEKIQNDKKILWLLDGYDELKQPIAPHLQDMWTTILALPNTLMTSRPTSIFPAAIVVGDTYKIKGFSEKNIKNYVTNFFTKIVPLIKPTNCIALSAENNVDYVAEAKELLDLLDKNPNIPFVAAIPINLELICSIWWQDKSQLNMLAQLTLTELYYKIMLWQLRRFLLPKGGQNLINEDEKRVLRRLGGEIFCLGKIALSMIEINQSSLLLNQLFEILPEIKGDNELYKDITNLGLFKADLELNEDHSFIHDSFRDFMGAFYIVNSLKGDLKSQQHIQAVQFIINNKYNVNAQNVYTFMAGLSSREDITSEIRNIFWNALLAGPVDIIGIQQICLLIRCLQATINPKEIINSVPKLPLMLKDYIPNMLKSKLFQKTYRTSPSLSNLLETVLVSPRIILNESLLRPVFEAFTHFDSRSHPMINQFLDNTSGKEYDNFVELLFEFMLEGNKKAAEYAGNTLKDEEYLVAQLLKRLNSTDDPNIKARVIYFFGFLELDETEVIAVLCDVLRNNKNRKLRESAVDALKHILNSSSLVLDTLKAALLSPNNVNIKNKITSAIDRLEKNQVYDESFNEPDYYDENEQYDDEEDYASLSNADIWLLDKIKNRNPLNSEDWIKRVVIGKNTYQISESISYEYELKKIEDSLHSNEDIKKLDNHTLKMMFYSNVFLLDKSLYKLLSIYFETTNEWLAQIIIGRIFQHNVCITIDNVEIKIYNDNGRCQNIKPPGSNEEALNAINTFRALIAECAKEYALCIPNAAYLAPQADTAESKQEQKLASNEVRPISTLTSVANSSLNRNSFYQKNVNTIPVAETKNLEAQNATESKHTTVLPKRRGSWSA